MKILAHRGYKKNGIEGNSMEAINESLRRGFGFESDVRDYQGNLVIAHDIANGNSLKIDSLLESFRGYDNRCCFAINIKSDGLKRPLRRILEKYKIENYFVFDMSIPQMFEYKEYGMKYFTRQSDLELIPCLYDEAEGVWIDAFYDDTWITESLLKEHLLKGKKICIVSPELHGRDKNNLWKRIEKFSIEKGDVFLCTDNPVEAEKYFNKEKGEKLEN